MYENSAGKHITLLGYLKNKCAKQCNLLFLTHKFALLATVYTSMII